MLHGVYKHCLLARSQLQSSSLDSLAQLGVDLAEHVKSAILDLRVSARQVARDVVNKVVLLASLAKDLPQSRGLLVVAGLDRGRPLKVCGSSHPLLVLLHASNIGSVVDGSQGRGVVRESTVVAINIHGTITLVRVEGVQWAVDRDLLVVDAQAVAVSVGVGKQTRLQYRVSRGGNTGDNMRGREGSLFNLSKVVLGVFVERPLAKLTKGVLVMGPDLGEIENAKVGLLGLLGGHGLDVAGPAGVLTLLDGLKEVLLGMVWVLTGHLGGLVVGQVLDALVGQKVDLNVVELALLVDPLVGVARVSVHVAVGSGSAAVTKELHDLVDTLLVETEKVPEHGRILKVGFWAALLGVDE